MLQCGTGSDTGRWCTVGDLEEGGAEIDALNEDEGAEEGQRDEDVLAPHDDDDQSHQAGGADLAHGRCYVRK